MILENAKSSIRSQSETRLIMIRIVIVSFVLFYNALSTSFIDAFLPDIMVKYGAAPDTTKAGKAAAWVTAGFCLGRFISANLWGSFIDKYGRKLGLLIILVALNTCTILFGYCSSYNGVLILRVVTGLVNGLSIVARTMALEVCPDDLKAWSISVTNSIWALGSIIGPVFGSMFYEPNGVRPTLGSAISVAAVGMILLPASWYYLEETLPKPSVNIKRPDQELEAIKTEVDIEEGANRSVNASAIEAEKEKNSGVLAIPNVAKLITIFSFNTFYAGVFSGLIIFWVSAKYEDGGLDFEYKQVSQIFLYFLIPQLLVQILAYPMIQKALGDYWMLNVGHLVHIPVFLMIPLAHMFGKGNFLPQKIWIVIWLFCRNMASFMNFSALQRFTNDVVPPEKRGKMNGIQVTCSSGLQVTGPLIGKWLLAWSMTNGLYFPFDYHFVFIFMTVLTVFVITIVNSLKFIDAKKTKLMGQKIRGA